MRACPFDVHLRPAREHLVIAPIGELDFSTAPAVHDALREAHDAGWTDIVIDLTGVTFMDSAGLHLLLELHRRTKHGMRCAMTEPSPFVARLLDAVAMTSILPRVDPLHLAR
jgi:anti-anti-sigma factor